MTRATKMGRWWGGTLVSVALLITLAGCYEHTYTAGTGAPRGRVVYESWRHHWLGGLISPDQNMAIEDVCRSGNATVHEEWTFLNGLVTALTGGIYSPTTVKVRCARGRRADLELSSEDVRHIVSSGEFLERVDLMMPERMGEARTALDALDR